MKRTLLTTLLTLFRRRGIRPKGRRHSHGRRRRHRGERRRSGADAHACENPGEETVFHLGLQGRGVYSVASPTANIRFRGAFLGYNNLDTTFRVSASKVSLGLLKLKPGVQIETVVKEAKALRTSQKGDTVSYNAGAFKVVADADVEGLLKKMPGITVTDGTVEAQGETVKKVFVDGKEFFGEDVTTAIKSLPAEAVDRVEVYNKLSDAAEFSGMDDGEGYKALNIVTRPGMRQGQFGKLYAGFGYDADTETEDKFKYIAGGNANVFSGDSRISFIGLFNNVNQQNFSFEDILGVSGGGGGRRGGMGNYMVRPQSGVASVNAIGVNYSDTWGKRNQVTFQGSYFFNNTNTENRSTVEKWYEAPMIPDTLSTNGYSDTKGYNHRFNARLEWKISENQNLMIRPRFSYQSNDPWSSTTGWQYGAPADGGSGYSRTDNFSDALRHGYNVGTSAVYRAKLGKNGRTITLDGSFSYSDNTNNSNSWSNILATQPDRPAVDPVTGVWDPANYTELRYLRNLAPSSSYSLRGSFTYTEPVAKYAQLSFQYRASYNSQERDKRSYITGDDFSTAGLTPDRSLSNSYESGYLTQSVGPGFRFSKERNTFIANVYYQRSALDGQIVRDDAEKIKHAYNNVTYFMMGQLNINRENSLRLFVSSYTDSPSITDLQSVYDVSDAQNISHGNPNLKPTYSHRVNFHYTNSNVEKGRTFMWMFSMNTTLDYTAQHLVQRPGDITIDGQAYSPNFYSTTENLDGYWQLRTHLSYGLPIGFLKSNFNVMAGVIYTKTPQHAGRHGGRGDGYDFGRRAQRHQEYGIRLPGRAGQQHFGERRLHPLVERHLQRGHQLAERGQVEEPLFQPHGAGQPEGGLPAGLHLHGERGLLAVYRLHERLLGGLPPVQRLAGQEGLQEQARRSDGRRQRPLQPEPGLLALDGFGLHAELDQQRHRPLLYGAVQLQPAPFRQEGFAQYKGLRRCRVLLRFPPHGTRRAGRTSSGDVPRTAVNRSRAGLSRLTRAISVNLLFFRSPAAEMESL